MLLYCVCFLMNYRGKSTIYLGCYSADPYPWIWDMFTHRKNDLLTMGQKYNVKMCAHLNLQKSFREQLVRFFWVIWCTYYQICKNHGSQLPESMGMGQGYRESSIPLLVHHIYMLVEPHTDPKIAKLDPKKAKTTQNFRDEYFAKRLIAFS